MILRLLGVFALAGFVTSACSSPDTGARTVPVGPDRANFAPVARVFISRCGELDCHGNTYRNFRLYGYSSSRLLFDGQAIAPDQLLDQPEEIEADYRAIVGIEPEVMSRVVADHGAFPERLTFIRKGRNTEDHKGLNPIIIGDGADKCILSWLASNVDVATCVATAPEPGTVKR